MFDTCHVEDYCSNPFAKEHGLNQVQTTTGLTATPALSHYNASHICHDYTHNPH